MNQLFSWKMTTFYRKIQKFVKRLTITLITLDRSSHPEVFLGKGVLKIYSKFTGAQPCRRAISTKLQSNFTEIAMQLY